MNTTNNPLHILLGYCIGSFIGLGIYKYSYYRRQMAKFNILIFKKQQSYYISTYDIKTVKGVAVMYNEKNYPDVHTRDTKNLECLKNKGYSYNRNNVYISSNINNNFYDVWKEDSDIDIDVFLEDCRECNVYTEIKYKEKGFLSDEYKYKKKRIPWTTKGETEDEKYAKLQ